MSDRELLELAARAAGIDIVWVPNYELGPWLTSSLTNTVPTPWTPLRDPGDALRLAVALHIELKFQAPDYRPYWTVLASERGDWAIASETGPDTLAATCRAITRAAAEIGKGMK